MKNNLFPIVRLNETEKRFFKKYIIQKRPLSYLKKSVFQDGFKQLSFQLVT